MNESRRGPRAGFTLVELLMVILIISMLIALLIPAVNAARLRALEASSQSQIEQLVMGLEDFKAKYGAYPPDPNWSDAEILTFLRRAWPRAAFTTNDVDIIQNMNEAEALVFWLGGIYDVDAKRLTGFCNDPRNPLCGPTGTSDPFGRFPTTTPAAAAQRTQVFQFDETRVFHADSNAFPEYYPPNARPQESCAFVYFAARPNRPSAYLDTNGNLAAYTDPRFPSGSATPYYYQPPNQAPPNPPRFMKDDTYQIVWAGIDNDYGAYAAKFFPTGQGYASTDNDNLTSFAKGRLGDSQ